MKPASEVRRLRDRTSWSGERSVTGTSRAGLATKKASRERLT